ncbi:thiamine phosphate synthase [Aliarcobacter vitoriensis]|uniref:thiamine phosphate synthase n=1 Tax=Aliarcobacter vitoriensis TaxID=2011099 RepID=UPI001F34C868|nr:thiamine phosphate synthase [Aliarcobacter vitoriensis]
MTNIKSYLITDPKYFSDNPKIFKQTLENSLKLHKIDFACFRDKTSTNFEKLAKLFLDTCNEFKIKNIYLNSNIQLAKDLNFDGVHLNSTQFEKIGFAKSLNLKTIISCHNHKELKLAFDKKVDFVTYSPIFDTPNKGEEKGIEDLKQTIKEFKSLNIFALGGIINDIQVNKISQTNAYGFASIRYFIASN